MIFEHEKIEELVAQCRLTEAAALLELQRAPSWIRAAVAALQGDDRATARFVDCALLACRSLPEVVAHYAATNVKPTAYHYLADAALLAWAGDAAGTYDSLRAACERAAAAGQPALGVAARERLAHHALLFGDVRAARAAIEEAIENAQRHRLGCWFLRCAAAAARLAVDCADLDRCAELLKLGRAASTSPRELALFAATGAQLAVELGDDEMLSGWSSAQMLGVALQGDVPESAISAATAGLIAYGAPLPGTPHTRALRRALLQADGAAAFAELYTMAARYGDLDEARWSVDALGAVVAANRPYLSAHQLLARAYFLSRSGERGGSVDCAGDAARAFTAMGLRRWTNDAMRMLVSQEPVAERRSRGRPTGSALTGREEQVAHLIRRGARNREVAEALQISEHTVERHVSSILGRLGLRSRWQIADPRNGQEY